MSGSILKEVTFTPYAFEKDFNFENRKRWSKLISILESLIDSGIIVTASSYWKEQVYTFMDDYNEDDKEELEALLKEIDSRNRIIFYPTHDKYDKEDIWIEKIKFLNHKRAFDFIAAAQNTDLVQTVENIDRKKYKNTGAKVEKQTFDYMKKMLAPILSYADIVKVIDPYFNLSVERFKEVLIMICEKLGNNHGKRNNGIIEIHTSIKSMLNNNTPREFEWQKADHWTNKLKELERKYGHTITINIWEENKKKNEWHERWIITNQCGIFIGKGSDISNWTDSTWGLLDWEQLPEISNKFNSNRQVYNFIGKINSSTIIKNQNPKNTFTYLTEEEQALESERLKREARLAEEERLKKNKEPKKLKRRLVPLSERGK